MEYIIFFLIIGGAASFLSKMYHKKAFEAVTVRRYFSKQRVFVGEELEVTYEITNHKRLPLFGLRIIDEMPVSLKFLRENTYSVMNYISMSVKGYEKITRTYKIKAFTRDYISSEKVLLSIKDIFGMIETRKEFRTFDHLFIYPNPSLVQNNVFKNIEKECSAMRKSFEEDPSSFHSIRNYNTSDSLRRVNWNKTSQYGKLMSNEYEMPQSKKVAVFTDLNLKESNILGTYDEQLEELLSKAVYISDYLLKKNYEVGFYVNRRYKDFHKNKDGTRFVHVDSDKGTRQRYKILDTAAAVLARTSVDTETIIRTKRKELSESIVFFLCTNKYFYQRVEDIFKKYNIKVYPILIEFEVSDKELAG